MCYKRLAENTGHKNYAKNCHLCTIAQLCRAISSQLRHVLTIEKNLLNSNISSTCPHNMVNFGPLTAEIGWRVWSIPANFNSLGRVIFAFNRGRHVHSATGFASSLRYFCDLINSIQQGAPCTFGWAAIMLSISLHSSSCIFSLSHSHPFLKHAHTILTYAAASL